jgi:hypothetical protein
LRVYSAGNSCVARCRDCRLSQPGSTAMVPNVMAPMCPSRSLTSVVAVYCLVASWLCRKARLDPAGESALTRRSSRGPALIPYAPTRASKTLCVALGFRSKSAGHKSFQVRQAACKPSPCDLPQTDEYHRNSNARAVARGLDHPTQCHFTTTRLSTHPPRSPGRTVDYSLVTGGNFRGHNAHPLSIS